MILWLLLVFVAKVTMTGLDYLLWVPVRDVMYLSTQMTKRIMLSGFGLLEYGVCIHVFPPSKSRFIIKENMESGAAIFL